MNNPILCRLKPITEAKCKLKDHMRKASFKMKTRKKNELIKIPLHLRHAASPEKAGEKIAPVSFGTMAGSS